MEVFIVDAVRTPFAGRNGTLSEVHAVDLAAVPLMALSARQDMPEAVDAVMLGCGTPIGEQGMNVARAAVLAAGWEDTTVASTIDAGPGSGMQALANAIAAIASGAAEVVVAGAVASMSRVPAGMTAGAAVGKPFGPSVHARFGEDEGSEGLLSPARYGEKLAQRYDLTRAELDAYAGRAVEATRVSTQQPWWGEHLVAVTIAAKGRNRPERVIVDDELLASSMAPGEYVPLLADDGVLTAGNTAVPADGAIAVLLASAEAVARNGWVPRARVLAMASGATSPVEPESGLATIERALSSVDLKVEQISQLLSHDESAASALALAHGGNGALSAIAIGEPLGTGGLSELAAVLHSPVNDTDVVILQAGSDAQHYALLFHTA